MFLKSVAYKLILLLLSIQKQKHVSNIPRAVGHSILELLKW